MHAREADERGALERGVLRARAARVRDHALEVLGRRSESPLARVGAGARPVERRGRGRPLLGRQTLDQAEPPVVVRDRLRSGDQTEGVVAGERTVVNRARNGAAAFEMQCELCCDRGIAVTMVGEQGFAGDAGSQAAIAQSPSKRDGQRLPQRSNARATRPPSAVDARSDGAIPSVSQSSSRLSRRAAATTTAPPGRTTGIRSCRASGVTVRRRRPIAAAPARWSMPPSGPQPDSAASRAANVSGGIGRPSNETRPKIALTTASSGHDGQELSRLEPLQEGEHLHRTLRRRHVEGAPERGAQLGHPDRVLEPLPDERADLVETDVLPARRVQHDHLVAQRRPGKVLGPHDLGVHVDHRDATVSEPASASKLDAGPNLSDTVSEDELAFYDALETNDSAVAVLGDAVLTRIARELTTTIRSSVTIDWTVKETVRAKLRTLVRRKLRQCGYPPDKTEKAVDTVIKQAELLAASWA